MSHEHTFTIPEGCTNQVFEYATYTLTIQAPVRYYTLLNVPTQPWPFNKPIEYMDLKFICSEY
jgi:hypothetical protein